MKQHHYQIQLEWTGNRGSGTAHYRAYSRQHLIRVEGKAELPASADPSFLGDPDRMNPEELLVSSLSGCHMLWYLHLCADAGIVVEAYTDQAWGVMEETREGGGYFKEVVLRPRVRIDAPEKARLALELHRQAHRKCFIANSCNFPVRHEPVILEM